MFGILLMLKSNIKGAVDPWDEDLLKGDFGEGEVEEDDLYEGDFGLLLHFGDNIDQNEGDSGGFELFNLESDMSNEHKFLQNHLINFEITEILN